MSAPRRLIVDTDTGSDDVWAIVEALRATDVVRVEAVTVVCGNLPLELCVKNALLAEDAAGRSCPPVFRGMERPLLRKTAFYAADVHGSDGLGEMDLPAPERPVGDRHAMDAIIDLARERPGELEIATCGPLTNVAMAVLKEPRLAQWVKRVWILGGAARGVGNMTPAAEYNVYTDPEAAAIVLDSGLETLWVTWDTSRGDTEITPEELERLAGCGDRAGAFCARCVRSLRDYQKRRYGRDTLGIIDSMLMTAVLYPEIMQGTFSARCSVELRSGADRGRFYMDRNGEANCIVCPEIDAAEYKRRLFALLGAG